MPKRQEIFTHFVTKAIASPSFDYYRLAALYHSFSLLHYYIAQNGHLVVSGIQQNTRIRSQMSMEQPIIPSNPATVTLTSMTAVQANGTAFIAPAKAGATVATKPKKPRKSRALKTASQNAHFEVVLEAARAVTQILSAHGLSCAIFGSLASKLYGCSRVPKVCNHCRLL